MIREEIYTREVFLDTLSPVSIYKKVKEIFNQEITFLFESVINNSSGNFSYIIVGARERLCHKNGESIYIDSSNNKKTVDLNPLNFLRKVYKNLDKEYYKKCSKDLGVGFVDGYIGYIGYDMVKEFEPTLKDSMSDLKDDLNINDLDLIRPKLVIAYSHKSSKVKFISFLKEFADKFDFIEREIKSPKEFFELKKLTILDEGSFSLSKSEFFDRVNRSKEMIKSGDVFQILISNRFTQKVKNMDSFSFYRVLRAKNPSPYLFYLDFEDFVITGSSPEVMVNLTDNRILLRPIAGTRKRGSTVLRDRELEIEMLNDTKELAEHIMLVDLGRNDVGRVAKGGSVQVTGLKRVERYSHVMHLVSDVEAELDNKFDMFDLFEATFTAGTMTGAPKIRAMELIAEFECLKRSFYSGSIGYFGFNDNLDSAITIRTAFIKGDEIVLQAGAGVVADSQNELEFLEVTNKMEALKSSLQDLAN